MERHGCNRRWDGNPYREGDEFLAALAEELEYGTLEQVEGSLGAEGTDMLSKPMYQRQCTRCGQTFQSSVYESLHCQVCSGQRDERKHRNEVRTRWLKAMADDSFSKGERAGLRKGMLWGLLVGAALAAMTMVGSEVLGIITR